MQREPTGEVLEFCDEFGVSSDSEIGLDAGAEALSCSSRSREISVRANGSLGEFDERHSAPQRERVGEGCRGGARCRGQRLAALLNQALETVQIKVFRVELQQVTGLAVDQPGVVRILGPGRAQDLAQPIEVHLNNVRRIVRRCRLPEAFDKEVHRHHPVDPQRQHREHRPLFRAAQRQLGSPARHLQRPQDPHLHHSLQPRRARTRRMRQTAVSSYEQTGQRWWRPVGR